MTKKQILAQQRADWSRASEVKIGRHLVKSPHFYNLTAKTRSIKANSSDRVTISVEQRGVKG